MNKILLNNNEFHFSKQDLPCLVHYTHGTGGSYFSVTIIADLFLSGNKVLFLTAYPMAKDNFLQQISGHEDNVLITTKKEHLNTDKQAILIESGNENLFLEALNNLQDINERIIFIKNFEGFDDKIILEASQRPKLIISGDIDLSPIKNELLKINYKTIIRFSKSNSNLKPICPDLEKYTGYFWQNNKNGLIKTIID